MRKFLALSILVLSFMGCSNDSAFQGMADDSDREAKKSDAAIALDNKEYDSVITSLTEIYNTNSLDPEVSRLLASAYMGKAGFDALGFIQFQTDSRDDIFDIVRSSLVLNPSPLTPDAVGVSCEVEDLAVLMVSDDGHYIDGHCIDGIIGYLEKAKRVFSVLQGKNMDTPSDRIQFGLISAVHFAILLGDNTADAFGSVEGSVPVPINKRAYYLYRNGSVWSHSYSSYWYKISSNDHSFYTIPLSYYQEDLMNMNDALQAYDEMGMDGSYLEEDLENLLRNILQAPSGDIESIIMTMTTTGITSYINNVLSVE